jgi:diguanylate cyclase (GGDEF)-like protein/PAS domain S-box-containing protein
MISALLIGIGNTAEGMLGLALIRGLIEPRDSLAHAGDVFCFAGVALLASLVGCTIGSITVTLTGLAGPEDFSHVWLTWWVGDSAGILVITPLILSWLRPPMFPRSRARMAEALALAATAIAVSWLLFGGWLDDNILTAMPFLIVPVLFWSSFRFGRRETATAIALIAGIAIWGTIHGHGDFARTSENQALLMLQIYISMISVGTMTLCSAYLQSWSDERALAETKERIQVTLDSIGDGVIATDRQGAISYLNPVAERLTGWSSSDALGQPLAAVYHILDEDTRRPLTFEPSDPESTTNPAHQRNHEPAILVGRNRREHIVEGLITAMRRLPPSTEGQVLVFRDVTQQKLMARAMAHHANHDELTGLVNRREFERRLQCALDGCRKHGFQHVLCYLDLDQFKLINDTAGHAAGDEALRQARNVLTSRIRQRDTLARLGGDEFGLLLEHCPLENSREIARSLVEVIRDCDFNWQGRRFRLGVSVGLVAITDKTESTTQLMSQADVACYTAKESGRGRVHVYNGDDNETVRRHNEMEWVAELRGALDRDAFELFCQPIVPLHPDSLPQIRYEILLRLRDSSGQLITPDHFVPAAERFGLMPEIDRWVIQTAFRRAVDAFGRASNLSVALNLSGSSLSDERLLGFIHQQFQESGLTPKNVCFELTESAAIGNLSDARRFVDDVRQLGCQLALDDFGTGLSSLAYLKTLTVDYLKIDGHFVRNIVDDPVDRAMVVAITDVGRIVGVKTVAEYAHSREVADKLWEIGVDYAQGFYFGAPMPLTPRSLREITALKSPVL